MNEFDKLYGDGGYWYLNPKNYDDKLLDDPARREYTDMFYRDINYHDVRTNCVSVREADAKLYLDERKRVVDERIANQKITHFGQIVPIEDMEKIFGIAQYFLRFACLCRYMYGNKTEFRSCYVISDKPCGGNMKEIMENISAEYLNGAEVQGLEEVTREEAIEHFRQMDKMGLVHTIWTLHTPFIGTICNCDPMHCSSLYTTIKSKHNQTLFLANYVAVIDDEKCVGCRACKMACPFGCIEYSPALKKAVVNLAKCVGCGVCRVPCRSGAIKLVERDSLPETEGRYHFSDDAL